MKIGTWVFIIHRDRETTREAQVIRVPDSDSWVTTFLVEYRDGPLNAMEKAICKKEDMYQTEEEAKEAIKNKK